MNLKVLFISLLIYSPFCFSRSFEEVSKRFDHEVDRLGPVMYASLPFHDQKRVLLKGISTNIFEVFDVNNGEIVYFDNSKKFVSDPVLSQDSKNFFANTKDHFIQVWNSKTGEIVTQFKYDLACDESNSSVDEKIYLSSNADQIILICKKEYDSNDHNHDKSIVSLFDWKNQKLIYAKELDLDGFGIHKVSFFNNNLISLETSAMIDFLEKDSGNLFWRFEPFEFDPNGHGRHPIISPDGRWAIYERTDKSVAEDGVYGRTHLALWDVEKKKLVKDIRLPGIIFQDSMGGHYVTSPSEIQFLNSYDDREQKVTFLQDGKIYVLSLESEEFTELKINGESSSNSSPTLRMKVNYDLGFILSWNHRKVILWDVKNLQLLNTFELASEHHEDIFFAELVNDGKEVFAHSYDNKNLYLWDRFSSNLIRSKEIKTISSYSFASIVNQDVALISEFVGGSRLYQEFILNLR